MSFTFISNYQASDNIINGCVAVNSGQLGLSEQGSVASDYTTTQVGLWTLFPDKPTRNFISADTNSVPLQILLPAITNTLNNTTNAFFGCVLFIYNTGSTQSIAIYDPDTTTVYKTLLPGQYIELVAYSLTSPSWVITEFSNPLASNTLQQTYDNSTPAATIQLNMVNPNGPVIIFNDSANTTTVLFSIEGNAGGNPDGNPMFNVQNLNAGTNTKMQLVV